MALPKAYGLDPDETWEIDFSLEAGRMALESMKRSLERNRNALAAEQDEAKRAAFGTIVAAVEKAIAKSEAEIAAYVPGPTSAVFVVGPIPNGKRAELDGAQYEALRLEGKAKIASDRAWAEQVVRWGVRGHRNFLDGKRDVETGERKPIEFCAEEVDFAGGKRTVVSRRTLEAYGPILGDLALIVLRSQQIDEAGKNV